MYNKGKNDHKFFIYGPQYNIFLHFWLFGGPWVAHKIRKQSDKKCLSYRVNDAVSADAAA